MYSTKDLKIIHYYPKTKIVMEPDVFKEMCPDERLSIMKIVDEAEKMRGGTIDFLVDNDVSLSYEPGFIDNNKSGEANCHSIVWRKICATESFPIDARPPDIKSDELIRQYSVSNKRSKDILWKKRGDGPTIKTEGHRRIIRLFITSYDDFDVGTLLHEVAHCKEAVALEKKYGDFKASKCGESRFLSEDKKYVYHTCVPEEYPKKTPEPWKYVGKEMIPTGVEERAVHYVQRLPLHRYDTRLVKR